MAYDLFKHENAVMANARRRLDGDARATDAGAYSALLDEYQKLLKETGRLVRLNDRNETALRDATRRAEEALAELTRTQAELVEAEKLAALGGLVAGVAHEVNTPVGIIVTAASSLAGRTRTLKAKAEAGDARRSDVARYFTQAEEAVALIEGHAARAAKLIENFKMVAVDRASGIERRVDLKDYVAGVVESLHPEFAKTAHSIDVAGESGIVVEADAGAIAQVVTNLVLNARDHAFQEGAAGRVTLSVGRGDRDAVLTCADDGRGVPESDRAKVFEPFFTTRRDQGGSGLGLHLVHNLVSGRLGGRIRLEETPGGGATFRIDIPLAGKTETEGDGA